MPSEIKPQQLLLLLADRIDDVVRNGKLDLPPAPNLLTEISQFTTASDSNLNDIVAVLEDYPAICKRIISVANSPFLAGRVEIKNIQPAIARLGISRLQTLAAGAVINDYLQHLKLKDLLTYYRRLWQRSIKVAAMSYVVATHHSNIDPEQALLAGLIHNIGTVPLLKYIVNIPELQAQPALMPRLSDRVITTHYAEAGHQLLFYWQLQPELTEITRSHQTLHQTSLSYHDLLEAKQQLTLAEVIAVVFHLSRMVDYCDANAPHTELLESKAFKKIWPDWITATNDMQSYSDKIKQIQQDITG